MNRRVLHLVLCLVTTATAALQAAEKNNAKAIVSKAIKAAGGRKALAKFNSSTWSDKGTYFGMGDGIPYTGKYAVQWPDKFKMEIENVFTICLNGDKGWVSSMGEVTDMTKEQLAEQQEQHHSGWVASLLPLSKKPFKLSVIGDAKIGDADATGVLVKNEGHRDVELYFDNKSGLLIKSQHIVKAEELGGKEVQFETFYGDYKEFDGAKMPTKLLMKQDGKKFVESMPSDLKAAKLDDSVFAKP